MEQLADMTHMHIEGEWRNIWKLEIPPKMQNLLWRAARDVVPSRAALRRRGVVPGVWMLCGCPGGAVAPPCFRRTSQWGRVQWYGVVTALWWHIYRMTKVPGQPTVKECEAIAALLETLTWLQNLGYDRVIVETDAQVVVQAV
ncbi:hypothetical protein LINPERHAP2_LOCUS10887 [Linum perenne]